MPTPLPEPVDLRSRHGNDFYSNFFAAEDRRRRIENEDLVRPIAMEAARSQNALRNAQTSELTNKNALSQFEFNKSKREDDNAGKKEVIGHLKLFAGIDDAEKFTTVLNGYRSVLAEKFGVPEGTIPESSTFIKVDKKTGKNVIDLDRYKTYLSDADNAVGTVNVPHEGNASIQWIKNEDTGKLERVEFIYKNGSLVRNKTLAMSPKEEAELEKTKAEADSVKTGKKSGKFYTKTYYDENNKLKTTSVPEGEDFEFPAGARLPSEVATEKPLTRKEADLKAKILLGQQQSDMLDVDAEALNNNPGSTRFYLPVDTKYNRVIPGTNIKVGKGETVKQYKAFDIPKDPEIGTYRPYSFFKGIADKRGMSVEQVITEYNNFVKTKK